jgi:methionine synthase I (cobalamin-dependent)
MPGVAAAELDEINRAGVAISRTCAGAAPDFASLGPPRKMLVSGEVTADQCSEALPRRPDAGGADALVVETMSDIERRDGRARPGAQDFL